MDGYRLFFFSAEMHTETTLGNPELHQFSEPNIPALLFSTQVSLQVDEHAIRAEADKTSFIHSGQ